MTVSFVSLLSSVVQLRKERPLYSLSYWFRLWDKVNAPPLGETTSIERHTPLCVWPWHSKGKQLQDLSSGLEH